MPAGQACPIEGCLYAVEMVVFEMNFMRCYPFEDDKDVY